MLRDDDTTTEDEDFWGRGGLLGAPAPPAWTDLDAALVAIRYLRRHQRDLDASLSTTARGLRDGYLALLLHKVYPALLHAMWVDQAAYRSHTGPTLFSQVGGSTGE